MKWMMYPEVNGRERYRAFLSTVDGHIQVDIIWAPTQSSWRATMWEYRDDGKPSKLGYGVLLGEELTDVQARATEYALHMIHDGQTVIAK